MLCLVAFIVRTAGHQPDIQLPTLDDVTPKILVESVLLCVQTTNALETNFPQLPSTQEVHLNHAWLRSSYEQPGSSLFIDIYYSCHSNAILQRRDGA